MTCAREVGPGCYSKASGGSFAASARVTGLGVWWGSDAIWLPRVGSSRLARPSEGSGSHVLQTPALCGLAVFLLSRRDALPHVGTGTTEGASRPMGSLGAVLPGEGQGVLPSSLRPRLNWLQLGTDFFVRYAGFLVGAGKFPELVHISQLRAKVMVWLPH